MATFDLNAFIKQPSLVELETCRKDDLFLLAQHFEISVSKTSLKKDLKACLVAGLVGKGVLPAEVNVPEKSAELLAAAAAEQSPSSSSVVEPVTPFVSRGEVGPSYSLPKFEPLSLSTGTSSVPRGDKVRLARLQLETQDKAQARKDELQHQLERYRIDAEMKVKV